MTMHRPILALLLLTALLSSGCAALASKARWPWKEDEEPAPRADRLVALWSNAVLQTPGKTATRGFGGRMYFYNERGQPMEVEGQLVVYAYDDGSPNVDSRAPDRKFVFRAEELKGHASESALGASYSVWLPWDAAYEGEQKEITLVPVFVASNGGVVMGQQTKHVLPGKEKQVAQRETRSRPHGPAAVAEARLASFHQADQESIDGLTPRASRRGQGEEGALSIRTTTISLPPEVKTRLMASSPPDNVFRSYAADQRMAGWNAPQDHRPLWPDDPRAQWEAERRSAAAPAAPAYPVGVSPPKVGVSPPTVGLPPSDHSAQRTPPAPTWPISRPRSSHAPWRPLPAGQPFAPAP